MKESNFVQETLENKTTNDKTCYLEPRWLHKINSRFLGGSIGNLAVWSYTSSRDPWNRC